MEGAIAHGEDEIMHISGYHGVTANRGIGRYRCIHCTPQNRGLNADVNVLRHLYDTLSAFANSIVYTFPLAPALSLQLPSFYHIWEFSSDIQGSSIV